MDLTLPPLEKVSQFQMEGPQRENITVGQQGIPFQPKAGNPETTTLNTGKGHGVKLIFHCDKRHGASQQKGDG
ncbi:hypothetical protein EJB05_50630 [Eragrostis curvula]|uniref:Uncharacterized protein n=1 Tax=Eragrostis curvula TaxID=38414 RepID=A0A5J9SZ73_9POAL|nr:hypothetical protein EJB05_50630 [Eragrostis curvula]